MSDVSTRFLVSIAVFRSEPADFQKWRHVSICFRVSKKSIPFIAHIIGPNRAYYFELRTGYEPRCSRTFVREVRVGTGKSAVSMPCLTAVLEAVRIDNLSMEFNRQLWVGAALRMLVQHELLDKDEVTRAIGDMIEATLEAGDG